MSVHDHRPPLGSLDDQSISASFWEQRYRDYPGYLYGMQPNAYLESKAKWLRPGMTALAVADGDGRNGVWLAEQGLVVLSVDRSTAAQQKAAVLSQHRSARIRMECADLETWDWPKEQFDVVVSVFAHFGPRLRPMIHRSMAHALKAGGLIILQGFSTSQHHYNSGGPEDSGFLFSADALRSDFEGFIVDELIEYIGELDEGLDHRGPAALVGLLARKSSGTHLSA